MSTTSARRADAGGWHRAREGQGGEDRGGEARSVVCTVDCAGGRGVGVPSASVRSPRVPAALADPGRPGGAALMGAHAGRRVPAETGAGVGRGGPEEAPAPLPPAAGAVPGSGPQCPQGVTPPAGASLKDSWARLGLSFKIGLSSCPSDGIKSWDSALQI